MVIFSLTSRLLDFITEDSCSVDLNESGQESQGHDKNCPPDTHEKAG